MKLLDYVKSMRALLLTKLNIIGSILFAYALANPAAATDLMNLLPPKLKTPVALMVPVLWFSLVQYAKMRAIKAGPPKA